MISDRALDAYGRKLLSKIRKKADPDENNRSYMPEFENYLGFNEELAARIGRKEDAVIAVTGERGKGKSTFSMISGLIQNQLLPRAGGFPFSWNNISFHYEDVGDIVEEAGDKEGRVYDIDEAIDVAMAKDAMTRANKELGKFMQKARKRRNIYFWNIPDFTELDPAIRNKVIHYWIHVYYKSDHKQPERRYALAAFFRRDLNPFNKDKWGFEVNSRITSEPIHDTEALMMLFRKTKSFVADLAYPAMPQKLEAVYEAISKEALKISGSELREKIRTHFREPRAYGGKIFMGSQGG